MSHWYDFGASLEHWNPDPDLPHDPKPVPYGEPWDIRDRAADA